MTFTRKTANLVPIEDTVFAIVKLAKEDKERIGKENVYDATIGSLYDEDGQLVAFDNVYDHYNEIDKRTKATYASSFTGNPAYRKDVYEWVLKGHAANLAHSSIATVGGTGAVSMTLSNILDKGQTVILPDIAWGSYKLMATQFEFNTAFYNMFDEEDNFNMKSFKETILKVKETQDKLLVVVNDPCHNPTGYSLTMEQWEEVIEFLNECSKDVPVVLLDDIAYIDYSYKGDHSRDYMDVFNKISDNVLVVIAFSCSKALTSYGLRCGAAILLGQEPEAVREVEIVFEKSARSVWSNIPNAAMVNFSWVVTENKEAYMNEKAAFVKLMEERSSIFVKEAQEVGLPIYPYKEGFFVTIKMKDNKQRDEYHQALMKEHIYTVCVNKGIRVAICSLPVEKAKGLAKKMKALLK